MPKIRWTGLPPAVRDHLFERLRERKITAEDLYRLKCGSARRLNGRARWNDITRATDESVPCTP
ncbi:MAG: hypothetical protein A3F74_16690 [Betaproteobacteria bacterium RIFCSPLOWO2_12_FULL_62_58]|nr:MAG: hypothetical protein A3F74_16690 [Betaproteobacteria bacterium RIFCSPLOWO2_12_FULL_62_58]